MLSDEINTYPVGSTYRLKKLKCQLSIRHLMEE